SGLGQRPFVGIDEQARAQPNLIVGFQVVPCEDTHEVDASAWSQALTSEHRLHTAGRAGDDVGDRSDVVESGCDVDLDLTTHQGADLGSRHLRSLFMPAVHCHSSDRAHGAMAERHVGSLRSGTDDYEMLAVSAREITR